MSSRSSRLVLSSVGYFASASAADAQSPGNRQTVDDLVRSAQLFEMLGYLLGGAGILLVILSVLYTIYADRKKKARKRASRSEEQNRGDMSNSSSPVGR